MILALLLGLGARYAFGWEPAPLLGLVVGLFAAPFVPRGGSNGEPPREPERDSSPS